MLKETAIAGQACPDDGFWIDCLMLRQAMHSGATVATWLVCEVCDRFPTHGLQLFVRWNLYRRPKLKIVTA